MIRFDLIPGAKRVLLEEGVATTNLATATPKVSGKLPGIEGGMEWRLLAIEQQTECSSFTADAATSVGTMTRPWGPVVITVDGWPEDAYNQAQGDAIYRCVLTQMSRPLAHPGNATAAVTTTAIRQRVIYPFSYMAGEAWYDSSPRADLLQGISVTRSDAGLTPGTNAFVAAPTHNFYAWIAPCTKVNMLPIAFSLRSWAAPSDLELVIPSADRLLWLAVTDTDDALVNTVTVQQFNISGRNMLQVATPLNAYTANYNRTVLPDGYGSPQAITEVGAATGTAASPEWVPLYWESGHGRNYLSAISCVGGGSVQFSADLGTTVRYHALRTFDPIPDSNYEARYVQAAKIRGTTRNAVSKKIGYRPGLPYTIR